MVEKFADYIGQVLIGVFIALALQSAIHLYANVDFLSSQELQRMAEYSLSRLCLERDSKNLDCTNIDSIDGALKSPDGGLGFLAHSYPTIEQAVEAIGVEGWVGQKQGNVLWNEGKRTYWQCDTGDRACLERAKSEEKQRIRIIDFQNYMTTLLESYRKTKWWECVWLMVFLLIQPWHLYVSIEQLRRHPFVAPNLSPLYAKGSPGRVGQASMFLIRILCIALASIAYGVMATTQDWLRGIYWYIFFLLGIWTLHDAVVLYETLKRTSHTAEKFVPRPKAVWADATSRFVRFMWIELDAIALFLFVVLMFRAPGGTWQAGDLLHQLTLPGPWFDMSIVSARNGPILLVERHFESNMLVVLSFISGVAFLPQVWRWIESANYPVRSGER